MSLKYTNVRFREEFSSELPLSTGRNVYSWDPEYLLRMTIPSVRFWLDRIASDIVVVGMTPD
jgi:hypothetical protein